MNTSNDCLVYPGKFIPLREQQEVRREIQQRCRSKKTQAAANISETSSGFSIELFVPGVLVEDFTVYVDQNILSVCVLHNEDKVALFDGVKRKEVEEICFDRYIVLPETADALFVSAEYSMGVLKMFFPKGKSPVRNGHTDIVVY